MISNSTRTISINTSIPLSYEVIFEDGFFNSDSQRLDKYLLNSKSLLIVDKNVDTLYGERVKEFFNKKNYPYDYFPIEISENSKKIETVIDICRNAKKFGFKRHSIFVAVGGGVLMDIVGFAASVYKRKSNYIRIPTTLVGIIDAGVGIKVGVNLGDSKNAIGGYHPPLVTINDSTFLGTLDKTAIRCGLYEIIKMAIVADVNLFTMLEHDYHHFLNKSLNSETSEIIYRSTLEMMKELEPNLYETNLQRLVDFGHTFSPFIEAYANYSIPHGEAVGIDIYISSSISLIRGILNKDAYVRIIDLITKIGFSIDGFKLPPAEMLYASLDHIRNHRAGNLNLVIPSTIGTGAFTNECTLEEIQYAYAMISKMRDR